MADPTIPARSMPAIPVRLARFDVDPDSTLPPEASTATFATPQESLNECPNYVFYRADQQESEYTSPTGLRTLTLATRAPAIRFPGTIINVGLVEEHLTRVARDRIPLQCRTPEFVKGSIELGDAIDTSLVSELIKSFRRERRMEAWDRLMRMIAMAPGNHEGKPNGTTDSGEFFVGFDVLGRLMAADGPDESYYTEIVKEEAGSEANIMNKEKFLKMLHEYLKLPWKPVLLQSADDKNYRLAGESKDSLWSDEKLAVENFWRSYDNGDYWQATIKFKPDEKLPADKQYLGLSAVRLDENTYAIQMDTTDLLEDSNRKGLLEGHISYVQVRLIQTLMAHLKSLNPKAKFVLNTHFPLDDLDSTVYSKLLSKKNHLDEILNDESVVAVMVAHTHKWGMKDLNSGGLRKKLNLTRRTPLLQYNVTSMMDWPVGAAQMTVQSDPEYLTLALHRIDFAQTLPSMDNDAWTKFTAIDDELNSFATAWRDMTHPKFKLLGHRKVKLGEQLFVAGDFHDGVVPEPGRFYHALMTHDAIPVEAVQAMLTMRLDQDIYVLELNTVQIENPYGESTSLRPAATVIDEEFKQYLYNLRAYYLNALIAYRSKNKRTARKAQSQVEPLRKKIDGSTKTMVRAYQEVMRQIEIEMLPLADKKKDNKISPDEIKRLRYLKNLHNIAFTAIVRAESAKDWFLRFGIKLAQGQDEEDLSHANDLRSLPYWRDMDQLIQNLPYDQWGTNQVSPATAYRLHIHERSAERRAKQIGSKPERNVPPEVTIRVNLATNEIMTLTDRLPEYTPAEQQQIIDSWSSPTDQTEHELDEAREAVDQMSPNFRHHVAVQAGARFGNDASAARYGLGWQFHRTLRDNEGNRTWMGVTVVPTIEYVTNGDEFFRVDNRVREIGGSVSGYFEALRWLGVGASVNGAAHWNSDDRQELRDAGFRFGGDLRAHIADGALIGYGGVDWYIGEKVGFIGGFMLDGRSLLDTFNVEIPWLGIHYGIKPKPPQLEPYRHPHFSDDED